MKKNLFIFFVLCPLLSLCQKTYFKFYSTDIDEEVFCLAEDENNDFYISGVRYINNLGKGYILKIDKNGNKYQDITSQGNEIFSGYASVFCTSPNRLLAIGSIDSTTSTGILNRVCVWEFDSYLNLISRNCCTFGEDERHFPQESLLLNDSLLYIGSIIRYEDDPRSNLSLLKIGLPFDSLAYFQSPYTGNQSISDIIYNGRDSNILVAYAGTSFKSTSATKLIQLDCNLNYLSSFEPLVLILYNATLCNYSDTSFLISSTTISDDARELHPFITEYSFDNELINSIEIPNGSDTASNCGDQKNTLIMDSIIYNVGLFNHVIEHYPWQPEPSWIQISRINSNFELIDQLFYGGDAFYLPFDIKETSDGNIMIIGHRYDANAIPHLYQKDIFVLCVNNEGLIVNIDQPTASKAQEAIVFPNPGSDYLQVKLAVQHKNATIRLFDTNGRAILEKEVTSDEERVSTTHLHQGAYIYSITAKGKVIGQGKWIKN